MGQHRVLRVREHPSRPHARVEVHPPLSGRPERTVRPEERSRRRTTSSTSRRMPSFRKTCGSGWTSFSIDTPTSQYDLSRGGKSKAARRQVNSSGSLSLNCRPSAPLQHLPPNIVTCPAINDTACCNKEFSKSSVSQTDVSYQFNELSSIMTPQKPIRDEYQRKIAEWLRISGTVPPRRLAGASACTHVSPSNRPRLLRVVSCRSTRRLVPRSRSPCRGIHDRRPSTRTSLRRCGASSATQINEVQTRTPRSPLGSFARRERRSAAAR